MYTGRGRDGYVKVIVSALAVYYAVCLEGKWLVMCFNMFSFAGHICCNGY